jgi:hypothetical protein
MHPATTGQAAPPRKKNWPLQIEDGAAITCRGCGQPFEIKLDIYLTGSNRVFYQGEMDAVMMCTACAGKPIEELDDTNSPGTKFRWTKNRSAKLYLVGNDADDEDE